MAAPRHHGGVHYLQWFLGMATTGGGDQRLVSGGVSAKHQNLPYYIKSLQSYRRPTHKMTRKPVPDFSS
jgi:hypothetical protein